MGVCDIKDCFEDAAMYSGQSYLELCTNHAEQLHIELTKFFYGEEFAEFVQRSWDEQVPKRPI